MSKVRILLPDNSEKVFDHEPTTLEVAEGIGARLASETLGAQINGNKEVIDLRLPLPDGTKLKIITTKSPEALTVIRHSTAHLMAEAVQLLWPEVKVTIGPVIENGFYYDFEATRPFTEEDLEKVEAKMQELQKQNAPLVRTEMKSQAAAETFEKLGEHFKKEIIEDLQTDSVSLYHQGTWFDLCRGPHVQSTGQIKAFKLLSVAGSYWRGDEKRQALQRIYGTAFGHKKELRLYLERLEEAKKRDHRKLGKDLGLFMFHRFAPGAPFFTPKGSVIYNQLQVYLKQMYAREGYDEVVTPQIYDVDLYHQSGHYENYRENMYFTKIDDRDFSVKPMNCPGHCLLYASEKKSYRDLPWRVADFGRLHRNERSGVIHGLTRVRSFAQDDAHIFCTFEQLQTEIVNFMKFLNSVYVTLGLTDYKIFLSTRPEKRMGGEEVWDRAEAALQQSLTEMDLPFEINPGDGAFYGPKLDIMFVDAIGRPWQLGTLQCDFNMPESFDLKYTGEDNGDHRPVMLHRAILGSLERFIGVYLEHTAGHLPFWLSPVQVRVLQVSDSQQEYAGSLVEKLKSLGIRVFWDRRNEKLGYKIREAQLQKTPYMVIIGEKEVSAKTVSLRLKRGKMINGLSQKEFFDGLEQENEKRGLTGVWTADEQSGAENAATQQNAIKSEKTSNKQTNNNKEKSH